jgi:hypothetical protein
MIFTWAGDRIRVGMPGKRLPKTRAERPRARPESVAIASMPAAEALSFLRETRGMTKWTAADMAKSLKISAADAVHVLAILELQGYVKSGGADEWLTTLAGEDVSGSKTPRYTRERVEQALNDLRSRIAQINRDSSARYRIGCAVAFGDFLGDEVRVQPAEVGIQLIPRMLDNPGLDSAEERKSQDAFLKRLRGRGALVHLRPYAKWMSERTHRDLL